MNAKRIILTTSAVLAVAFAGASHTYAMTEHCPDGGTKYESGSAANSLVLPAGTLLCVKGSTDATGIITADGESTLFELLGNGHDVSYYVIYEETPTSTPTATPSVEPSDSPLPSSTATPTPPPSASPSPTLTPSPSETPVPTPSSTPTPRSTPMPTPPATDTEPSTPSATSDTFAYLLLIAMSGVLGMVLIDAARRAR